MGKYFGTDGFRGEANVNLTYEHAIKIGRFLGWYYGTRIDKKAKVVIGKDTRRSSYMFEYALCTGLMASGADAYIMHVTTTPSVAYITRVDDFDCGIMISASHNPYYDNGIKLLNGNGEKMDEETILKVEDYIDGTLEIPLATRNVGRTVDYTAGRNRYIGYLISLGMHSLKLPHNICNYLIPLFFLNSRMASFTSTRCPSLKAIMNASGNLSMMLRRRR